MLLRAQDTLVSCKDQERERATESTCSGIERFGYLFNRMLRRDCYSSSLFTDHYIEQHTKTNMQIEICSAFLELPTLIG